MSADRTPTESYLSDEWSPPNLLFSEVSTLWTALYQPLPTLHQDLQALLHRAVITVYG